MKVTVLINPVDYIEQYPERTTIIFGIDYQKWKQLVKQAIASNTITPTKKPPKRELSPEQKEENKQISQQRIFIEHLIRRLKIFRLAGDKFRLNAKNYSLAIYTICGLVRLRLGTNSWLS